MAKKKVNGWLIAGIALGSVLVMGAAVSLFKADTEKKLNVFHYQLGAVDEDGKVYESDAAMVSKLFSVNELKVEFDKEAESWYKVHFYDEDEKYLSSTELLQEDYEYEAEEDATEVYARIEIVPVEDEDGVIGFWEKGSYADDVTVTYNPELLEIKE